MKTLLKMNRLKEFVCHPNLGELIRFCLVGTAACLLQYFLYYLLLGAINYIFSHIISYGLSMCANFFLSAYFTFRVKPSVRRGNGFFASHALNFTLQFLLLNLFVWMGLDRQFALIPVLFVCIPINFLLVRISMLR